MESIRGGRSKKLIRALEVAELHGRPTCSECTDDLKKKRGCKRPGYDIPMQGGVPVRWLSPALQSKDEAIMYECPVGYVLRTTPLLYEAINVASYHENTSIPEFTALPRYMQHLVRLFRTETHRMEDIRQQRRQAQSDAKYGARARAGGTRK